jgi:hypothetical protein
VNEFRKLSVLLAKLHNKYYFRVGGDSSSTVLHFLVGRLAEGSLSGWAALIGIGIALE